VGLNGGLVELRRLLGRWLMGFLREVLDRSCRKGDRWRNDGFCWRLYPDVVLKFRCCSLIAFRRYKHVVR